VGAGNGLPTGRGGLLSPGGSIFRAPWHPKVSLTIWLFRFTIDVHVSYPIQTYDSKVDQVLGSASGSDCSAGWLQRRVRRGICINSGPDCHAQRQSHGNNGGSKLHADVDFDECGLGHHKQQCGVGCGERQHQRVADSDRDNHLHHHRDRNWRERYFLGNGHGFPGSDGEYFGKSCGDRRGAVHHPDGNGSERDSGCD